MSVIDHSRDHSHGASRPAELTIRAVATGVLLGALLTPCNVYSGLKIGWSFNMSIAAGVLAAGFWHAMGVCAGTRPLGLLENNINQTAASASASIVSAGLVAPIPALTLLTGVALGWQALAFWVLAVSVLGVVVAAAIRRQMIEVEQLSFPAGIATAETMTQIHTRGGDTAARLRVLVAGAAASAAVKAVSEFAIALPRLALPFAFPAWGAMRTAAPASSLGFAFDPSLLMLGFGAIIGLRAGLSLLVGAVLSWGVLAPVVLFLGWAQPGEAGTVWFEPLVTWLLWPGVTLLVVSALVSLALLLVNMLAHAGAFRSLNPRRIAGPHVLWAAAAAALVVVAGGTVFDLSSGDMLLAVVLSYVLAIVAARVTGETGITPIGALGKITQLSFAAITPGSLTANLMTANVTGGAAGQCADLLQDFKTGHMIGANPRHQVVAQMFGVATGSLVGSFVYLLLVPDPRAMLITPEWPAPAVATWKAVAEVLAEGMDAIPAGAVPAMAVAAVLGVAFGVAERFLPARIVRRLPSAPAMGLAFVIPAWTSFSLFLGAAAAAILARFAPRWAERRTMSLAAGLVAGESLVGVAAASLRLLG